MTIAEFHAELTGRIGCSVEADRPFYAASTMKVAVLIALFGRIDAGRLDLDHEIELRTTFPSVLDGQPFEIDPEDTDPTLTGAGSRPVRELAEAMITDSSNNATNLLLTVVPVTEAHAAVRELGAEHTVVARPIGDLRAAAAGVHNLVTARDLVTILTAIATERAARPASCRAMTAILTRQQHRDGLPSGLPGAVRSASKGGWVDRLRHDVAVVWPATGRPYCQAVCTEGLDDPAALAAIRARASAAYSHYAGPTGGQEPPCASPS